MKMGDGVYVHGYVDEICENTCTVIVRNDKGCFVTDESDVTPTRELHSYLLNKAYDNVLDLITTFRAEHDEKCYHNACDEIEHAINTFLKSD